MTEPRPTAPDAPVTLDRLPIFAKVSTEAMDQIGRRAQKRTLQKGELLFNTGDDSDALYVVTAGRVRIWTVSAAGVEITLNVQTPGAVFGEIGMLDGSVRTAGASAMMPSELISISRKAFFDAMERDPQLARNVIALLCQRLRWTSARMEDAALRQAPQRLARLLGHLARDHSRRTPRGLEISIKLTQGELAQWTAMSRESLNKLLNRWIDDGIILQDKGVLTICKPDELEDLEEFAD